MDVNGLIDFIAVAGKLKKLSRTGWLDCGVPDSESVADHSFRVALISLVLADMKSLNTLRAVRMALLHDLVEAETGDLTPTEKSTDPRARAHRFMRFWQAEIKGDEARAIRDAVKAQTSRVTSV